MKNVNHIARQVGKTQMNDGFFNALLNSKRPLNSLTKKEFEQLKECGMLWELYPEAPEYWKEIEEHERNQI